MMPIGPLMIEHRLIERMLKQAQKEMELFRRQSKLDPDFIDIAVDFIRTYADRCHHGKEEDILFRDLATKDLSDTEKKDMQDLINDHRLARQTTGKLLEAKARYVHGEHNALEEVLASMKWLVDFYPVHIEKEDRHFFIPTMNYFSKQEQDAMLQEFYEFDRKLIHEKYQRIVEGLEGPSTR